MLYKPLYVILFADVQSCASRAPAPSMSALTVAAYVIAGSSSNVALSWLEFSNTYTLTGIYLHNGTFRPYHGSCSQSLALQCGHPHSVLFLSVWDLCCTKWHRHRLLLLSTEAFHCLRHPASVFVCHWYQGCTNPGCQFAMATKVGTVCVLSMELVACHHSAA